MDNQPPSYSEQPREGSIFIGIMEKRGAFGHLCVYSIDIRFEYRYSVSGIKGEEVVLC